MSLCIRRPKSAAGGGRQLRHGLQDGCVLDTAWHGTHNTERLVETVSTNPKWEIPVKANKKKWERLRDNFRQNPIDHRPNSPVRGLGDTNAKRIVEFRGRQAPSGVVLAVTPAYADLRR